MEKFRNKYLEICELDPAQYLLAPRLMDRHAGEKANIDLELKTHIDMQLMVEKGFKSGIWHEIWKHAEVNHKYKKNMFLKKNLHF